jgi:hypothetical protein
MMMGGYRPVTPARRPSAGFSIGSCLLPCSRERESILATRHEIGVCRREFGDQARQVERVNDQQQARPVLGSKPLLTVPRRAQESDREAVATFW